MKNKVLYTIIVLLLLVIIVGFVFIIVPNTKSPSYLMASVSYEGGHNILVFSFDANKKCIATKCLWNASDLENAYAEIKDANYANGSDNVNPYSNVKLEGNTLYANTDMYLGLTKEEIKEKKLLFSNSTSQLSYTEL